MKSALRIGEVAKLLGVTPKTLRHYERVGLLEQPERTEGGYRLYGARDLVRLLRIRRLHALGLPLKTIALLLRRSDAEQEQTLRGVLALLAEDLAAEIARLERRRTEVLRLLAEGATSAALERASELPDIVRWAQQRLGTAAETVSPDVLEQDARIFGLLGAFNWPAGHAMPMPDVVRYFEREPEQFRALIELGERVAALAHVAADAPEVDALAHEVAESEALQRLRAAFPPEAGLPDDAYGATFKDLMLHTLSPAQRRFVDLVTPHLRGQQEGDTR